MKKHLHETVGWPGPVTHRQYETWQFWLREEWNIPSRTDWYLMQAACESRRFVIKNPGSLQVKELKLKFRSETEIPKPELTRSQADSIQKSRWFALVDPTGKWLPKLKSND